MSDKRLDRLEEEIQTVTDGTPGEVEWSVEWGAAAPTERPEGMAYDAADGELQYDTWDAQEEFIEALNADDTDVVGFLAGYGAGKSVTGARWLLTQAIRYPGSQFLAMGIDFTKARDTTFRTLFKNLPGTRTEIVTSSFNGPENSPLVADYNRAEHRLTLVNDSVVTLGSADKWNRYAGAEYGGIWLDEPSHYGNELFDLLEMMGSRLRGVEGPKKIAMTLTGNGFNAAYEILEKRRDANGDPLGIDIELIRASTLENPYLDDATKERFQRQYGGSGREEQALYGGFAAAQGLVYSDFRRDRHVIDADAARDSVEDGWRLYGYDSGWRDPRVLLEIGRTPGGQYVVLDEFYRSESHVGDAIAWLDDKPDGTIICEHNPSDIDRFERAGYTTVKAEKDIEAGIADVRRRLEEDANFTTADPGESSSGSKTKVFDTPAWSQSSRGRGTRRTTQTPGRDDETDTDDGEGEPETEPAVGLLVSEQCEHLVREFQGYQEDDVGSSSAEDHCLDALRYIIHSSASSETDDPGKKKNRGAGSSVWYDPY